MFTFISNKFLTKTEARSTQISKTKHPQLENEDP